MRADDKIKLLKYALKAMLRYYGDSFNKDCRCEQCRIVRKARAALASLSEGK